MAEELLRVTDLHAYYGESHILHGANLHVSRGEVVTLLGRNGAGRTTTLKAIMGIVRHRRGSVRIGGREAIGLPAHRIARLGLGFCPEERGIYSSLSTEENLLLPPAIGSQGMSLADIYALFPNLKERRKAPGTRLSGGEQQMLAVARILRTGARLLLLDEISEGLAPVIVQALVAADSHLAGQGYTIVMVEQNFRFALPLADRFYLMEHGRIVDAFTADELPGEDGDAQRTARCMTCPRKHARRKTKPGEIMSTSRIVLAAVLCLAGLGGARGVHAQDKDVVIGDIDDLSGTYADVMGAGGAEAIKMAIADFGGTVLGRKITVLLTDHQNKPDVGATKFREWADQNGLNMLIGGSNPGVSIAMAKVAAREEDPVLRGRRRRLVAHERRLHGLYRALRLRHDGARQRHGDDDRQERRQDLVLPDRRLRLRHAAAEARPRRSSRRTAARTWARCGCRSEPRTSRRFCCRRKAPGAAVLGLANAGGDFSNSLKSANEFGITKTMKPAALLAFISNIHSLGLQTAQGL